MSAYTPPWLAPDQIEAKSARHLALRQSRAGAALGAATAVVAELGGEGSHVFALTKGQFSMIDAIAACLDRTGPASISLWTWCVVDYELLRLAEFCRDDRIDDARLVVDRAGALRQRHFLAWWLRTFGSNSLRVTKSHAKVAMVRAEGWNLVLRGSMNLNENPRMELIDISNSADAMAMVEDVMAELWRTVPAPLAAALDSGVCSQAFAEAFGG